jgi:hypothetical protein
MWQNIMWYNPALKMHIKYLWRVYILKGWMPTQLFTLNPVSTGCDQNKIKYINDAYDCLYPSLNFNIWREVFRCLPVENPRSIKTETCSSSCVSISRYKSATTHAISKSQLNRRLQNLINFQDRFLSFFNARTRLYISSRWFIFFIYVKAQRHQIFTLDGSKSTVSWKIRNLI